jgi:hypothetical protein
MNNNSKIISGKLIVEGHESFLLDERGKKQFRGKFIWDGYTGHWEGKKLNARVLQQRDYSSGDNIIVMWPADNEEGRGVVELYYNERLVKYPVSLLGHIALNVDGCIFNFSHLINENEIITPEEYFFRPALGEFSPHPETGMYNDTDPERPYLDKFGRQFMRTIHVLRIEGLDNERLMTYCKKQLEIIYATPPDPGKPDKYADFNIFRRSCSTIIRDGFRECGFTGISGVFPRDLFVNMAYFFFRKVKDKKIRTAYYQRKQLKVPEAGFSKMTPLINPLNRLRSCLIRKDLG